MKTEDFLAFVRGNWRNLAPTNYEGLDAKEVGEIQQFEQEWKEMLWLDLRDLCQRCSDTCSARLRIADAYRKVLAGAESNALWPGHVNRSEQCNRVVRDMMVYHWNTLLNWMALRFNGMLGDQAAEHPREVVQQRFMELLHEEIRQYDAKRHAELSSS
jgi:hypothetical protein